MTHRGGTAGCLQQTAAYSVSCPVYSLWWNTGWCHLIANSEYSTCLSVFWRNKRDGGNSCGGRERGGSQDITQGLCLSSPTQITHIPSFKYISISMNKYLHTETCNGTPHSHQHFSWHFLHYSRSRFKFPLFPLTWDINENESNSYPLPVSLLCPGGVLAARMPNCWSWEGRQRFICK